VIRWTTAKEAATAPDVEERTVWRWVRQGVCRAKRLPGPHGKGRVLVGVDADGFPVPVVPVAPRARRRRS
jgi:hypothetical protein